MSKPTVLITRPVGQEAALRMSLEAAGYRAVACPMITIEPALELSPAQRTVIHNLDQYQHVIFVSSNAVRFGMDSIGDYWPQLPVDLNWYTVGEGSARALAEYGVSVQRPLQQMTSEGLLEMDTLQNIDRHKVLIVRGEGGRDFLRTSVSQRGALVQELAVYRRERPIRPAGELFALIRDNDCRALMLNSGEGLHNMVSLLTEHELRSLQQLSLVVPGERVAAMAQEMGFAELLVAGNATDEAMIKALAAGLPGGR